MCVIEVVWRKVLQCRDSHRSFEAAKSPGVYTITASKSYKGILPRDRTLSINPSHPVPILYVMESEYLSACLARSPDIEFHIWAMSEETRFFFVT